MNEIFDNNEIWENGKKENNVVESKWLIVDFDFKKDDIFWEKCFFLWLKRFEIL